MKKIYIIQLIILSLLQLGFYLLADSSPTLVEIITQCFIIGLVFIQFIMSEKKEKSLNQEKLNNLNNNMNEYIFKLNKTFESVADGIIITDSRLNITMANKSASYFLDIPNNRIIGLSLVDLFDKVKIFGRGFTDFAKIVLSQKKSYSIQKIDFGEKNFEDSIAPILDTNGNVEGIILVFRDITEKVKSQNRTKELENQLFQNQKMDAIGELSGGIAHDFNNILTSINGYVDLIDIDIEKKNILQTKQYIEEIRKNIDNAASLTSKLITFNKNQIINQKVYDINKVINCFLDIMRKGIGENIDIELSLNSTQNIKADKGQLEQILLNLMLNAKDAILEKRNACPKIVISTLDAPSQVNDSNNYIIIRCSDNGVGMDDEVKQRLFEPFFTTKKLGRGLGLSSIYGIVKQNHGFIYVHSEKGIGTTFEIFWPSTVEEEISVSELHKKNKKCNNNETIMFVEDNESIRDTIKQYLEGLGYKIILAENGRDALSKICDNKIDLIITDVIMPEMGGYELVDNIKKIIPNIKVILTSGYINSNKKETNYYLIKKPYNLETISQKISKIMSE